MKYLGTITDGKDMVTKEYVDDAVPSKTSDLTNDSGFITSPNVPYFTCDTAAATVAKVATLVRGSFTSSNLISGAQIAVKFTYANGAGNPTLSANGTTAKSIKRYGTTAPSTSAATSWNAGSVVMFTYDGTYWQQVGFLNSTYSEISLANATNATGSGTGLASGRRLKAAVDAFAPVTSVNGNTGAVTITETDPVFTASAAYGITSSDISDWNGKQDALVSGTNIKTINNQSLLGSGNLSVGGGGLSFDDVYPVGSIYMSANNTNPGTLFGGTWTQIQDTFLLAAGSTYTAGNTGGSATVTLQESELPNITGSFYERRINASASNHMGSAPSGAFSRSDGEGARTVAWASSSTTVAQDQIKMSFGSGNAHENMPPYLVVYVWQRTA